METFLYAGVALVTVALLALVAVVFSLVGALGAMADRMFAERVDVPRVDALARLRGRRPAVPEPPAPGDVDIPPSPLFSEQHAKDFDARV